MQKTRNCLPSRCWVAQVHCHALLVPWAWVCDPEGAQLTKANVSSNNKECVVVCGWVC